MNSIDTKREVRHHAFLIEADAEEGSAISQRWIHKELQMNALANPDVIVLTYGLLSVSDARKISELAAGAPFVGKYKVVIIRARRAYHEAQNALLKLFEEPPQHTYLFLIVPSLGGILATLRSRVQILDMNYGHRKSIIPKEADEFIKMSKEKRTTLIKKLTSGKDEDARRENREEAIALLNGIEASMYTRYGLTKSVSVLSDIATLRGFLYDRSAPVKMILEHLALVITKELL